MQIDGRWIDDMQARRLLTVKPHPALTGVRLLDYTPLAQYSGVWDAEPGLLHCRGTVVNGEGAVIAFPFRKFFNVGERPETQLDVLANLGIPEIGHKLDGSMVSRWWYEGAWHFTTRGSFDNDQTRLAKTIWQDRYADRNLSTRCTHVFELTGPDNRIVVAYPENELTLIGVSRPDWEWEMGPASVRHEAREHGLRECPAVSPLDVRWRELGATTMPNFEGYVLSWTDIAQSHVERRAKVKLAEYLRLHRIITGLSEHTIWEMLSAGEAVESLRRDVPEELHGWFDETVRELEMAHGQHRAWVETAILHLGISPGNTIPRDERKGIAARIASEWPSLRAELFRALDGEDYDALVWKKIEPGKATP